MCDPVSIGAIAVGTLMQAQAANQVDDARGDALRAETDRQSKLFDEANAIFGESIEGANRESVDKDIAESADKRNETIQSVISGFDASADVPAGAASSAPRVVRETFAKRLGEAEADSRARGEAVAKLGGFGDAMFLGDILDARRSGRIGTIGNFAEGSASVLPYELQAANQAGAGWNTLGSILQGVGYLSASSPNGLFGSSSSVSGPRSFNRKTGMYGGI